MMSSTSLVDSTKEILIPMGWLTIGQEKTILKKQMKKISLGV